jgi:FixJ family two-component response regulator
MSGRDLAEAARGRRDDLAVLFASGFARNEPLNDGRLMPYVRLLHKPYSIDSLADAVREAIDTAAARRTALR